MGKFLILFWLIPLQVHPQIQGKIKLNYYTFNPNNPNEFSSLDQTVWYLGNQSIQNIPTLDIKTDSTGTHMSTFVKYYLFIDPSSRKYFYYDGFSDTARLIKHFKKISPITKHGGWDMYANVKGFEYENSIKLSDTIFDGNVYGRYKFPKNTNGELNVFIAYVKDEKFDIPIKLFKFFSDRINQTIVRMDTYYQGRLVGIMQLQYLSEKLTSEEEKIFKRWNRETKLRR
jgi:hypothetical protein